jgi:hypothetical protein
LSVAAHRAEPTPRCRDRAPRVPTAHPAFTAPLPTAPRTPRRRRSSPRPLVRRPPRSTHHCPDSRCPDRRCPSHIARTAAIASPVARCRRRRAVVSTPVSRRPAVSRAPVPSRRVGRGLLCTWAEPTPQAWAMPALCIWAEREFGPVNPVKFY